jgi:two-component system, OmpR family, sensor kinase
VPRLYWRIYLHFLGVLFVVGLAATLVFAFGQRSAFQRQVTERVARHVSALVAEAMADPAELGRRVRQLHDDLEVDVAVRDATGRLLAAAGPELRAVTEGGLAELRRGAAFVHPAPWLVAAGVRAPGSDALVAVVEVSAPRRLRGGALWRPGIAVTVVLLVVALAAAPLARRIARPVERLTEAARRLGRGELGHRVPAAVPGRHRRWRRAHRRPDELAELTGAFNDMAERIERLVTDQKALLANVSHELRSPLARIRVALALLPRDGESERRLADVEADLAELERLIDDVLTTARLEATGAPPHRGPVDLRRLLGDLVERAAHDPITAGKAVRVADGPAPVIQADAALLKRAVWNLVENAAKYGAPPIALAATGDGPRVVLSVTDEGEGIPAAERERVLAPFHRLDRARTPSAAGEPPRGFGLGLTLARRIAEAHGGTIAVGPAVVGEGSERGCRVAITLPRV